MTTLLQTLLSKTFKADTNLVLSAYIKTVLPAIEQQFGMIPVIEPI
ncbi:MAG TPA: hypothetical protein V6D10_03500 [Trichocoleus sp.]|jgi:hypothetical protein